MSHVSRFSYLTSPSIGRKRVDSRLQTEGMVAFVTHVTHKHFGVLSWVPTQKKGKGLIAAFLGINEMDMYRKFRTIECT